MRATPSGWWMNSSPDRRVCPACARSAASNARRRRSRSTSGLYVVDLGDQLLDEVFAVPLRVEDAHRLSVLSGLSDPFPREDFGSAKATLRRPQRRPAQRGELALPCARSRAVAPPTLARDRLARRDARRARAVAPRARLTPARLPTQLAAAPRARAARGRTPTRAAADGADPGVVERELAEDPCAPRASTRLTARARARRATRAAPRSRSGVSKRRRTTSCGATVPFQWFSFRRHATSKQTARRGAGRAGNPGRKRWRCLRPVRAGGRGSGDASRRRRATARPPRTPARAV